MGLQSRRGPQSFCTSETFQPAADTARKFLDIVQLFQRSDGKNEAVFLFKIEFEGAGEVAEIPGILEIPVVIRLEYGVLLLSSVGQTDVVLGFVRWTGTARAADLRRQQTRSQRGRGEH